MMKRALLFLPLIIIAFLLSAQEQKVFHLTNVDSVSSISLDKYWKFHNGDNISWASPSFDDSSWDTVETGLPFLNDSNSFTGIAWLRLHLNIDSSIAAVPLYMYIDQRGASEMFLDGKLLYTFGKVSNDPETEIKYNPHQVPFIFKNNEPGEHILAIRYSNLGYRKLYDRYRESEPGFNIELLKQDMVKNNIRFGFIFDFILAALGIFFTTLGFVHLLFFLFYKKQRTNLFYTFFVALLGFLFLAPLVINNTFNPELKIIFNYYYFFAIPLFFYSMLVLEYSLFKRELNKYFWFSTAFLIVAIASKILWSNYFSEVCLISFIISTVIASFFIVIKSIIRKIDGAWILGVGSLFFLVFMLIFLSLIVFGSGHVNITTEDGTLGLILLGLIFLAIMSIPVSMSIYLARDFAKTSKNLEKKLEEVEDLSAKTLEQEKDKQRILESQKEMLETQVTERTSEIVEQKTIIERKNKDITDSIDYAKTIQKAILPTNEYIHALFPESFILFKPKDIVSGDFYWFAEKNGKKIVAACDCTGHGVPGALMSMIGNNLLHHIVNERGITSSDVILNQLHKEIRKTLRQEEQQESRDGMDIAILVFNSATELEFSGAQRPLWIVESAESGYTLKEIKGDKFAIGGLQSEKERTFSSHRLNLSAQTALYIFSDGFADQFSDVDKKLMTSRFKELILKIQDKPLEEQQQYLGDFIDNWRGKREQIDDILVIGLKI